MVRDWHACSNTLVLLSAPDELSLTWLADDAGREGLRVVAFHEHDLGGSLTAVALEPAARRLVSHLPLLLNTRGGDIDDHVHRSRPEGRTR